MLTKLIDSNSFFKTEEAQVTLLTPSNVDGLIKRAATNAEIETFLSTLEPDPSKSYLHINAMGAGEYYGPNKNGDYFPEAQLIKYHKTFEDTGYVYRHHINKDPLKSMGKVIFSVYNTDMHRVELIAWVDKVKGKDILSRLDDGEFPMTSMACRTPFDVCSICSNKASTRAQYCTHLNNELLQVRPDGKQVMSLNLGPLKFFDISVVLRPADVTSSILAKVASAMEQSDAATVGSAEMAERLGIADDYESQSVKSAALRKLSELVKEVEGGEVMRASSAATDIMDQIHDVPHSVVPNLLQLGNFNQVLNALAQAKINPSSQFYMALLHHAKPEGFQQVRWEDSDFAQMHPEVTYEDAPTPLKEALAKFSDASSVSTDAVEKRAYYWEQTTGRKKQVEVIPEPVANANNLAMTTAGAMILNHTLNDNPENKKFIDRILSVFFGAALLSKLSVSELSKTHSMLNSSNGMNKHAGVDKSLLACNINENFVVEELLRMKA